MQETIELVDGIMDTIEQLDAWQKILMEDPRIARAETELKRVVSEAAGYFPKPIAWDLSDRLLDCALACANAYTTPAIIFGMRVIAALHTAPITAISERILQRSRGE